jgi:hypothetical protein
MVLTPRVCWNWVVTAALGAAVAPALSAETKVRFWAGAAANCLAVWRRARETGLEAIVNVWIGSLKDCVFGGDVGAFKVARSLPHHTQNFDGAQTMPIIAAPDQPVRVTSQLAAIAQRSKWG